MMTSTTTTSRQSEGERRLREDVSIDEAWGTVERLAGTIRLSGNEDERAAIDFLTEKLAEYGVDYDLHRPELFISWPLGATLRVLGADGFSVTAKTPAMSISTDGEDREGGLVYVPTGF